MPVGEKDNQQGVVRRKVSIQVPCDWDGIHMKNIRGVGFSVRVNGGTVWSRDVYERFTTPYLGYVRKPWYPTRLKWAESRQAKVAGALK